MLRCINGLPKMLPGSRDQNKEFHSLSVMGWCSNQPSHTSQGSASHNLLEYFIGAKLTQNNSFSSTFNVAVVTGLYQSLFKGL